MMGWIRNAWDAARGARVLTKHGAEKIVVMRRDEFEELTDMVGWLNANFKHSYDCIEDMVKGFSCCRYCMEHENCHSKKKGNLRGCEEWVMSYPDYKEDEDEQAAETEDGEAEQEDQEADVQEPDEGRADGRPLSERDHTGGSQE